MEQLDLTYLPEYRVILCRIHGYCISPKLIRRHLWDMHAAKGEAVQQAVAEIQQLDLVDPTAVKCPPANGLSIQWLNIVLFFRCLLPNCQGGPTACSQRRETVYKHQAKDHSVGLRKKIKPTGNFIEQISMQSFFAARHAQWFQVQPLTSTAAPPSPAAIALDERNDEGGPSDLMQQWWNNTYTSTQDAWQAAHTTDMNSSAPFGLLTDTLLADYCKVSRQFQQLARVQAVEVTAGRRKRPGNFSTEPSDRGKRPLLASRRYLRHQLWTWPAIEQSLKDLFGSTATARDGMQRDALRLLASNTPESIIVLPTGGGKSTLYLILSRLSTAEVTIVIIPFIAPRQDLIRRCGEHSIPYWHYNSVDQMQDRLHAVPNLVFVDVDTAVTANFLAFFKQLYDIGRVDRLILDEAHLVLTASDYCENLGLLGKLRQVECPFVCLTATLPPHGELDLAQSLYLSHPVIQRASSDRPNLAYCVQLLGDSDPPPSSAFGASSSSPSSAFGASSSTEDRLLHAVIQLCRREMQQWQASSPQARPTARGLCFVRQRAIGTQLAQSLDCEFYHARLPASERASMLTAWSQGQRSPFLVATSALGAGIDYPSVRRVVHVDAPEGLVAYGQETGRAGRDGLPAVCTVVLPPRWCVSWDRRYRSDFMAEDVRCMTQFLETRHCLRQLLTGYLDGWLGGREGTACHEADGVERVLCQHCQLAAVTQSTGKTDVEQPRAPPVSQNPPTTQAPGMPASLTSRMHGGAPNETESTDQAGYPIDVSSESASSLTVRGARAASPNPTVWAEVMHAAARFNRLDSMESATAQALYEQRLATWGRACIPCSFRRRRPTSFPHQDCMQTRVANSLTAFRRAVPLEGGVGCLRCGQPRFVCQPSGQAGCRFPWFVFHCCWVAVSQDTPYAVELIRTLGGPYLTQHASLRAIEQRTDFINWIGRRGLVFGHVSAANAMRLAWFWMDRLEMRSEGG